MSDSRRFTLHKCLNPVQYDIIRYNTTCRFTNETVEIKIFSMQLIQFLRQKTLVYTWTFLFVGLSPGFISIQTVISIETLLRLFSAIDSLILSSPPRNLSLRHSIIILVCLALISSVVPTLHCLPSSMHCTANSFLRPSSNARQSFATPSVSSSASNAARHASVHRG